MKLLRRLLYLGSFFGLAVVASLGIDRIGRPSIASLLVWVIVLATLMAAPGLVSRRAWPLGLVLLPLGALLLLRTQMSVPPADDGLVDQVGFYLEQLRSGVHAYATRRFPLDLATAGDLRLLLLLIVYALVGLAAFFALSLRKAMPAVVILMLPVGFGLTVDKVARVVWLPLAFFLLAAGLLLLSRALQRARWTTGDGAAAIGTATIAALVALAVLGATSVATGEPWQNWRTWKLPVSDGKRLVFDSMEGYAGLLDPENDEEVMRVTSSLASYWRANALDEFNGTAWFSGGATGGTLSPTRSRTGDSYTYAVPSPGLVAPGTLVRQVFTVPSMQTDYFFTGGTAQELEVGGEVPVRASSANALGVDRPLGPRLAYAVTAVVPDLEPADLVARGRDYPQEVLRQASLPFPALSAAAARASEEDWRRAMADQPSYGEWLGLFRLNREIVGDATDPYEIALRIERYLRLNYRYSLAVSSAGQGSQYAAFLLDTRTGFCQHFAGAMAVLLRFNGIPARVAVGFATGAQAENDTYVVRRNNAHAWVEAYFPQVGWVPFEPTPGQRLPGSGPSSTTAAFTDPFYDITASAQGLALPEARSSREPFEDLSGAVRGGVAPPPAMPGSGRGWLFVVTALAAVVLGWPLGRVILRRIVLRRGDAERRLRTSMALVRTELREFGVDVPRSQTLEETAGYLRNHLDVDASAAVDRVQSVVFGGRPATAEDLTAIAHLRRELRRRLRARAGWRRAVLALYGLPAR